MKKSNNNGILSYQYLKKLIEEEAIISKTDIDEDQLQPASIDLRLGERAYRLISSFLPWHEKVEARLHMPDMYNTDLVMYEFDLSEERVLEKGGVYLIPLMEELKLPDNTRGRVNPKSTTGRLDVFARVITDGNPRFDDVATGYKGKLYLEVMPRSFAIKVKKGHSLAQLRLMKGKCTLTDSELKSLHKDIHLLYDGEEKLSHNEINISKGLFMSVDLNVENNEAVNLEKEQAAKAEKKVIGYKSKKNSHVVDLTKKNYYNIEDFWEPVYRHDKKTLILEPEDFYILSSKEKIRIPHEYAAEMVAYEAGSGELRTHYAGFFDPGFGFGAKGEVKGTKAVLEVRAHDVPFMIGHGQTFCKLFFEKMLEVPEKVYGTKIGSSYQFQGVTLSKQFKNF